MIEQLMSSSLSGGYQAVRLGSFGFMFEVSILFNHESHGCRVRFGAGNTDIFGSIRYLSLSWLGPVGEKSDQ
jgi:hypothetical protein